MTNRHPKVFTKGERVRCSADNSEGVIEWGPDPVGYYLVLDHDGLAELLDGDELEPVFTKNQRVRDTGGLEGTVVDGPDNDGQYALRSPLGRLLLRHLDVLTVIPEPRWVPVPGTYRWKGPNGGGVSLYPKPGWTLERLEDEL